MIGAVDFISSKHCWVFNKEVTCRKMFFYTEKMLPRITAINIHATKTLSAQASAAEPQVIWVSK